MAQALVTVYRSADMNARQDAEGVLSLLREAGLAAEIFDDTAPGVVEGSYEVRVPADQAAAAEQLLSTVDQEDPGAPSPSHLLDPVTVARTAGATAEMEALAIQSLLEANGIPAILVGTPSLPVVEFEVRVAAADEERARQVIREAEAAGPAAASEAELQSEA